MKTRSDVLGTCMLVATLWLSACGAGDEAGSGGSGGSGGAATGGTTSGSSGGTGGGTGDGSAGGSGGSGNHGGQGGDSTSMTPDPRCADAAAETLRGLGTKEDPFLICHPEQLRLLDSADYPLNGFYALGDDLNVVSLSPPLTTIGEGTAAFGGSFDGRGWSIAGLTHTLFEHVDVSGSIENLRLSGDIDATAQSLSWGLLTKQNDGAVHNVAASGTFSVPSHAGILIGTNSGVVEGCASSGTITGAGAHIGGLVGVNLGTIRRSWSSAAVVGSARVGGLVGRQSEPGAIEESYAVGSAECTLSVGGLLGTLFGGLVLNCYALAEVTGPEAGGLVGHQDTGGESAITNCFAASSLVGDGAEGLVGAVMSESDLTVTSSYFPDAAAGTVGTPLSSAEMAMAASFSGWDFETVWHFAAGSDYPSLRFQQGQ